MRIQKSYVMNVVKAVMSEDALRCEGIVIRIVTTWHQHICTIQIFVLLNV